MGFARMTRTLKSRGAQENTVHNGWKRLIGQGAKSAGQDENATLAVVVQCCADEMDLYCNLT